LILIGGTCDGSEPCRDAFLELSVDLGELEVNVKEAAPLGTAPAARYGHSTCSNEASLFVFGGLGPRRRVYCDLFQFDASTQVWREIYIPQMSLSLARAFHAAAMTPTSVVFFGGESERGSAARTVLEYHLDCGQWSMLLFPSLLSCAGKCGAISTFSPPREIQGSLHDMLLHLSSDCDGDDDGVDASHAALLHGSLCAGVQTAHGVMFIGGSSAPMALAMSEIRKAPTTLRELCGAHIILGGFLDQDEPGKTVGEMERRSRMQMAAERIEVWRREKSSPLPSHCEDYFFLLELLLAINVEISGKGNSLSKRG
jgi:hypothetical protein